jgi:hypothetical protein
VGYKQRGSGQTDKICLLIDVAIPLDSNILKNESQKKLKYKDLSIQIQRM